MGRSRFGRRCRLRSRSGLGSSSRQGCGSRRRVVAAGGNRNGGEQNGCYRKQPDTRGVGGDGGTPLCEQVRVGRIGVGVAVELGGGMLGIGLGDVNWVGSASGILWFT